MSEIQLLLKKLHTGQMTVINERKRFNVLKCGRRFGKSELLKDLAVETLLNGGYCGYWYPVYKDGAEIWRELKYLLKPIASDIRESGKEIMTITGGKLDMWSMEDPDSGRGRRYHRALIDEAEKAKHLKDAWELTIRGTLADFQGDAYIASTPKFGPTYFKTKLFNNEREFDNWKSFKFTTYDNPFISQSEIDEIKSQYAPEVFNCEFMALDVDLNKNRWAFAFDRTKHLGRCEATRNQILYLSFDFNRNPISCVVAQHYDSSWKIVESIKLANSDIYALCTYIKTMYQGYMYMVTGDATGQNSSAMVRDNINYYTIIRKMLELNGQQMRVPSVNPKMEDNQVLFNSVMANYSVLLDEKKCEALVFDLENVASMSDGRIDKGNRDDPSKQADLLDCMRYLFNTFMYDFLKRV